MSWSEGPINNSGFLEAVAESILIGLTAPKSPEKVRPLHGAISEDLEERTKLPVFSLRTARQVKEGATSGEKKVLGAYREKRVDIAIWPEAALAPRLCIGVKAPLNNITQNYVNMFENVLGDTLNLRTAGIEYAHVLVIPVARPFFTKDKIIKSVEHFTTDFLREYVALSFADPARHAHAPAPLAMSLVRLPDNPYLRPGAHQSDYNAHFHELHRDGAFELRFEGIEAFEVGELLVINDYEGFVQRLGGMHGLY